MIELINIKKNFGKTEVLKNVSLKLDAGQCIGLIGPNACGKTTMIKAILSMVIPSEGNILFNGNNIIGDVAYKNHIGYMPQIGRYPENMSIRQVVNMIKNIRKYNSPIDEELWHAFGLDPVSDKKMSTLSGGTTQKVSATLAFLFNPDILILDEPTAGLDPLAAEILRDKIIKEREKGKLILITSHLLNELDDLLTHVIFMQDGEIILHETIEDLYAGTGETKISKAINNLLKSIKK
ncbi:MAG: ABC transporter ATP-binding protein [Saprospiraceae bacterium]|nr:ABC transporter ATP-binding protein [Saprospiraceae bacterium]MBP6568913.1 ABC transporter ATP-binding protein [Saprospiraceae bacterium]